MRKNVALRTWNSMKSEMCQKDFSFIAFLNFNRGSLIKSLYVILVLLCLLKILQELRNCPNWAKKGLIERKAWLVLVCFTPKDI